jgi:O-antigen/teichoic acid export membrane protein
MSIRKPLLQQAMHVMRGPIARSTIRTVGVLGLRLVIQTAWLLLVTRMLGQRDYGLLAGTTSLAFGIGTITNVGFNYLVVSRMARDEALGLDAWRMAWPVTTCFGLLLAAVYILVAGSLLGYSGISRWFLAAIAVSELVLVPNLNNVSSAVHGTGKVALAQVIQLVPILLRLIAVIACYEIASGQRLAAYAGLHLAAAFFALSGAVMFARRYIPLDIQVRRPNWEEWKQGASFALMSFTSLNPAELDKAVALRALGAAPAGLYAAATRALAATVTPVIGLLLSSQPRLFRHAHSHDPGASRLVVMIMLVAAAWGIFASLALYELATPLAGLFGAKFAGLAPIIELVAFAATPMALRLSAGAILMALEQPLLRALYELIGLACLVALMLVLIPAYGIRGGCMALVASEVVFALMGIAMTATCMRRSRSARPPASVS